MPTCQYIRWILKISNKNKLKYSPLLAEALSIRYAASKAEEMGQMESSGHLWLQQQAIQSTKTSATDRGKF